MTSMVSKIRPWYTVQLSNHLVRTRGSIRESNGKLYEKGRGTLVHSPDLQPKNTWNHSLYIQPGRRVRRMNEIRRSSSLDYMVKVKDYLTITRTSGNTKLPRLFPVEYIRFKICVSVNHVSVTSS